MAKVPPIPVQRYLVPEAKPQAPEGFTLVDQPIVGGLPFSLQLDDEYRLVVAMPTGLAATWRDADPTAVVSHSADEVAPWIASSGAPVGDAARPPARLVVQRAGATVAAVPLAAGLRRSLPDSGQQDQGVRLELVILSWDLRAGSLRGPGDFGSRLSVAWRRADRAVEQFSTPPVNPHLVARLPHQFRMESALGLQHPVRLWRFSVKKVVLK